ncbi:MAG: diguanylate cyclase [Tardiphaga sp.]|nr:diguanylate cyclase [Tardiphaga sp.]
MLSVPTLFTVFTVNFLAMGLVWTYIMTSYPNFAAARYWTAAAFAAATGTGLSMLRGAVDPWIPIVLGGALLLLASSLGAMGISQFYHRKVAWQPYLTIIAVSVVAIAVFTLWHDDMPIRTLVYSLGQSLTMAMTLPLVLSRRDDGGNPGARMAGAIALLVITVHAVRSGAGLLQIGGAMTLTDFNSFQAVMVLLLVFLSMAWNFGFLLMAIDALRREVADLALVDDLTGVANRRHLLQRLTEQCALSLRTEKPFALLAIDLDGFKEINDGFGHAAGDACLRRFTAMAQTKLRPGDLFARSGGDEFCVVLPATALHEGAIIARRIIEACRDDAAACAPGDIPVAASIGVAQWQPSIGNLPERLIASADQALYRAKKDGKNRYAVCDFATPPLAPEVDAAEAAPVPMRRTVA